MPLGKAMPNSVRLMNHLVRKVVDALETALKGNNGRSSVIADVKARGDQPLAAVSVTWRSPMEAS